MYWKSQVSCAWEKFVASGVEGDISKTCLVVLDEFKEGPLEVDKDSEVVPRRGCTCKIEFIGDRDSKWLVAVVFDFKRTC